MVKPFHAFTEDSNSGAGNCICGASEHHMRHPHAYRRAHRALIVNMCVCTLPEDAQVHDESLRKEAVAS